MAWMDLPRTVSREARGAPSAWTVTAVVLAASTLLLYGEGRLWWCECGSPAPWKGDVWTSHCSQHLADPYSISHFSHGLIFFSVFAVVRPRWSMAWRFCASIFLASFWEVLENSPLVIERYRSATMSLDYLGDSVINSLGDIAACALGFVVARRIGILYSMGLFVVLEVVSLLLIKDNLTLNVLMLIWPVEAIKQWQTAGHV